MNVPTGHLASRGRALLLLLAVLVVVGAVFAIPTPDKVVPLVSSGLPASYQSTEAQLRQDQLPDEGVAPALVVVSREDGAALTDADKAAVDTIAANVAPLAVQGQPGPPALPTYSEDGTVALIPVPVDTSAEILEVADSVTAIREAAEADVPAGLVVQVTGGPAFLADIAAVFEGANVTLLAATATVVAILLLITYRSPWLWIVPLVDGRRRRAVHAQGRRPARAAVRHRGRRVGGRHHERARLRRRDRLRAAAHRALPRPAAHRREPLRRHALRGAAHRRADPRLGRHRHRSRC